MIIELLLNLVFTVLKFAFGWINLPQFPEQLTTNIDSFLGYIFNNLTILGFFIRPVTLTLLIPTLIIVLNFDHIYKFTMWILRKIPFLGMK